MGVGAASSSSSSGGGGVAAAAGSFGFRVSGEESVPSGLILAVVMQGGLEEGEPLMAAARSEARSTRVL